MNTLDFKSGSLGSHCNEFVLKNCIDISTGYCVQCVSCMLLSATPGYHGYYKDDSEVLINPTEFT